MYKVLLVLIATSGLSGCVALAAGAAGATIANPKGAGQVVSNTGNAVKKLGKDIKKSVERK